MGDHRRSGARVREVTSRRGSSAASRITRPSVGAWVWPTGTSAEVPSDRRSATGLVPFRCPWHGKSRLRRELPSDVCDALSYAMFRDVVATLGVGGVGQTIALVHGPCGVPAALRAGALPLVQPSGHRDLTSALRWALSYLTTDTVLVATADVPCLRPSDVAHLLCRPEDVVVAPTHDGGTAAIKLPRSHGTILDFGGESAVRHLDAARRRTETAALLRPCDSYRDVDVHEDLVAAVATGTGRATTAVVRRYAPALGQVHVP